MTARALADMMKDADAVSDGTATVAVGSNWGQGRTSFGGLVAALGLTSMRHEVPADRPLRSLLVTFAGPVFVGETVNIAVEVLRSGGSATMVSARISGEDDGVRATLQAVYGATREAKAAPAEPGTVPDPNQFPTVEANLPGMPAFLGELDIKWTGTGIPRTGSADRQLQNFVRLKDETGVSAAAKVALLADMPPPIMMSHYKSAINAASMSWSLDFVEPPRTLESGWLYLDYSLIGAQGGYSQQAGKLYTPDGRLVAVSNQTMAYFDPKPQKG